MKQLSRPEIQVNNLEAQLKKLKEATARAVKQTHDAVEVKEGYLLEIANLESELSEKRDEKGRVVSAISQLEAKVVQVQQGLEAVKDDSKKRTEKLEESVRAFDVKITDKRNEYEQIKERIAVLKEKTASDFAVTDKALAEKTAALEKLESDIAEGEKVLEGLKEQIEEALQILDHTHAYVDQLQEGLAEKQEELDDRESKLLEMNRVLKQREKALDQKEKDLKVYEERVRKQYKKAFPERKMLL